MAKIKNIFILKYFLLICLMGTIFPTQAHVEHTSDSSAMVSIFHQAVLSSPEMMEASQNLASTPYIKIGSDRIYLNSHFWNLVAAWLRVYKTELSQECECNFTVEEMIENVRDHKAEGAFSGIPKNLSNLSGQGTMLVQKYGYVAATIKVAAEVAETVLSLFVGGKGLHAFCNTIDLMIFPAARMIQSFFSKYRYGKNLSHSGMLLALKSSWISYKIHKARKRVFLEIQPLFEFSRKRITKN